MTDRWNYLFSLNHLSFDVPYTQWRAHLPAPAPAILAFGSMLLYCSLIFIIFPAIAPVTEKAKSSFSKIAQIHYQLLCFYSTFCFLSTLYHLVSSGEVYDFTKFMCDPIPGWLRIVSISFTLSKIWEWGDTMIDIFRGKTAQQIGFLHCYHHATTFALFLSVMNFPVGEKTGMLLNGFVHSLMYYHYAFRLPKQLRPLITLLQIVQLVSVTYLWHITPDTCVALKNFPNDHPVEFLMPYSMVPVYIIFFLIFFYQTYLAGPALAKKNKVN